VRIRPFRLERYFARYEFSTPYLLSCSDCEPLALAELLARADRETLGLWQRLRLGYTESQGLPALREEVARLYAAIRPDDVLVVAPEEGIFIAINCLLERGDHVICPFPCYQSLSEVASSLGCEVSRWSPVEANGWQFDLDALERLVRPSTKLIIINFPHNPTGSLIGRVALEKLLAFARDRGICVLSDEMYRLLEYDAADRLPAACDVYENAISLFGMSKSFALAGLRIGWLASRNPSLMERMQAFRDYTTICSSAPSEVLALMGLRAKAALLERNLAIIGQNLRLWERFVQDHATALAWSPPRAGTVALAKLLLDQGVEDFCRELAERKGVMLLPGQVYDYEGNYFRIGLGRRNMPEALGLLGEFLDAHVPGGR
jgi:aspartate/methionine/tyrosine aminotransferase